MNVREGNALTCLLYGKIKIASTEEDPSIEK